jgi:hypothetical protein
MDVADIEIDDLLDAGTGVVEQEKQGPVASLGDGIDALHQLEDFIVIEVLNLRVLETGRQQFADPAAALQILGSDRGNVTSECLDRSKAVVAGARARLRPRAFPSHSANPNSVLRFPELARSIRARDCAPCDPADQTSLFVMMTSLQEIISYAQSRIATSPFNALAVRQLHITRLSP